jgi:galactitol-specific phosphotransferase system IIC component
MRIAAKVLAIAGCLAILFGALALDFIPAQIFASLPPDQRAQVDRSVMELEWIDRGWHSMEGGAAALFAALVVYVISLRLSRPPDS